MYCCQIFSIIMIFSIICIKLIVCAIELIDLIGSSRIQSYKTVHMHVEKEGPIEYRL